MIAHLKVRSQRFYYCIHVFSCKIFYLVQQSENTTIKQEPHSSGLDADIGSSSDVTWGVNEPAGENPSSTDEDANTMNGNVSSSVADASTDVKIKQ